MKFIKKEYTLTGIVMHMENSVTGVMDAYLYVKPNAMVKLLDPNKKITCDNFGSIDSKKVTAIGNDVIEEEFVNANSLPDYLTVEKIQVTE